MGKPKLKAKGILLDLDGTLVDSRKAYLEAIKAAFAAMGHDTVDVRLVKEIPKRLEQNLPIDDLLKGVDVQEFLRVYLRAYYGATSTKSKPIDKVDVTLRKLSAKTRLALVTMRYVSKAQVMKELGRLGLDRYFEHVVTALDTHNPKPSPEALVKCAEVLGVDAAECVVVGDSVADIRAGKRAGAKTVAVLTGIFSREELEKEKPDLVLESVRELPDFIE